ncbi:type II CAAX prenyl endopeptidase Rce1 family protein [Arthrobacter sp. MYb216]|uniref:CPBP family glutamic-type intramembrane protease n=2 Tax=unclassified Arthrobacter TaxID=235627 RepID=UPI0011B00268|nr:CPBP family glutamic-type intramembrane protease [Arthrobacter sp. MYb216]
MLQRHRMLTSLLVLGGYAALAAALIPLDAALTVSDALAFGALLAALWFFGSWLRSQAAMRRSRSEAAERETITAERARIAHELHDVVTHHVTAMVVQAEAGQFRPNLDRGTLDLLASIAGMMCAIAVSEEVFFRGVVFRLLRGRWGTAVALGASAILFGLVHLVNPDASLPGAFAIMIEAGIMLGAAYLATRSLWLAIGVHFGWNFATTGLFWIDHLGFRGPRFAGHRGDQRTGLAFRGKLRAGSQHRRHLGVLGGYRGIPGHCASSRPAFASTSLIARGRIIMPGQGSAFDRVQ